MIAIGETHALEVVKHVDFGVYLDGGDLDEILLPNNALPENEADWEIGKFLTVFIYLDSEDRPIATTEIPRAEVGDCALLTVVGKSEFGAFLDWGLAKDLLAPFKEQRVPMEVGRSYVVCLYLDKTGRIAASSFLGRHLAEENDGAFEIREQVDLLIASRSDLGYKAVINGSHLGLIHNSEIVRPITIGDTFAGYIQDIRPDGRINLTLQRPANEMRDALAERILAHLEANGGQSPLTDKSPPDDIYAVYHASKANYKKALGKLYKDRKVTLEHNRVRIADQAQVIKSGPSKSP